MSSAPREVKRAATLEHKNTLLHLEDTADEAGRHVVEKKALEEWEKGEEFDPSDPYRVIGVSRTAADPASLAEKIYYEKSAQYAQDGNSEMGVSRVLDLRLIRAYLLLSNDEARQAYDKQRLEVASKGSWARLRYANGLYEGAVDPDSMAEGREPVRHGKGVSVMACGEKYEGEFSAGVKHGTGLCFWQEGDLYLGQWKEDKMAGSGCYYYGSGSNYFGEFVHGRTHGSGRQVWPDGSVYTGDFMEGRRTGHGLLVLPSGKDGHSLGRYEGQWMDGHFNGTGVYESPVVGLYEGEFLDGAFHGDGKLRMPDGHTYQGAFTRGRRDGTGVYEWPNGDRYTGPFRGNRPDGEGSFESHVRSLEFMGHWENGVPQGQGVLVLGNIHNGETSYSGQFDNGEREGQGAVEWPSGTSYAGRFLRDKPHGLGSVTWPNGSTWEGSLVKGSRDGAGIFTGVREDGTAFEQLEIWQHGKRIEAQLQHADVNPEG